LSRKDNRDSLTRLFQGYVTEYGPTPAEKIISIIVNELGGIRLTVPDLIRPGNGVPGPKPGAKADDLIRLSWSLSSEFSFGFGKEIMRKFFIELKGLRVSFPDWRLLYREERARKIRASWNGSNIPELAIRWGISETQVRRIIADGVKQN